MSKEQYLYIIGWAEAKPLRKKVLCRLNQFLPVLLAGIYMMCLVLCFFVYPVFLIRLIIRPALCFLSVTVLRYILKFPRPYDVYGFVPICGYHPGKNRSFPSRHAASAAIIALEIFHLWSGLGIFLIILALFIGALRILCGNHFVKDVLAAYVIAFLFNIL